MIKIILSVLFVLAIMPNAYAIKLINLGGSSNSAPSDSPTFTGTSTFSGNLDYGSNTTHTYNGGITRRFPASGPNTVTNADMYALVGLGAEGNIVTLLGDKVADVNGTCTGLTLTNPTILGIFTFPGNGFTWAAGSSTLGSNGTMTLKTTAGSNANVVLDPDGTGSVFLSLSYGTPTLKNVPQLHVWPNGTASTLAGTTTETVMGQVVVPGGLLGTKGQIHARCSLSQGTTTSYNQNPRLYVYDGVGTTTLYSLSNTNNVTHIISAIVVNTGSTSANFKYNGTTSAPDAVAIATITNTPVFSINTQNQLTFSVAHSWSAATVTSAVIASLYDLRVETMYED